MTKDELCIRAAKYAVQVMKLNGSYGYVTPEYMGSQRISWDKVYYWLDNVIEKQNLLEAIDSYDTFGFIKPNCFVRNPKGNVVTYLHYDDVIKCIKGESEESEHVNYEPRKSREKELIKEAADNFIKAFIGTETEKSEDKNVT
jgi:hypothetical protein